MLDPAENRREQTHAWVLSALFLTGDAGEADERIELVDSTVGVDAQRILGDPLAAGEAGFTGIAPLGVNTVEGDAGIVKRLFRHVFIIYAIILRLSPTSVSVSGCFSGTPRSPSRPRSCWRWDWARPPRFSRW